MAGVFREVEIEWQGATYSVTPDMRLLRRIESKDISLMHVTRGFAQGKPQIFLMATIIGEFMRAGGASVTDDEIAMVASGSGAVEFWAAYNAVIEAISPVEADEKKPVDRDG